MWPLGRHWSWCGISAAPAALGVCNVQDYGAAGDGVASDTAEIQAALNAAADGDVVYFPPGTYMTSGLTLSTDGVTLLGAGATLKRNAGSVMLTVSGDRMTINGLTFNANYTAFLDADKYSINIANGTADTTITDCRFVNGGQATAIWMAGDPVGTPIQRTTVRGCYFGPTTAYGAGVGLTYDVADLLITECRFILAADDGVHDPQSIAVRSYAGTVKQVPRRLRIIDNDFEMQSGTAGGPGYPYAIGVTSDGSATFDPRDVVVAGNTIRALGNTFASLSFRGRDQRRRREQHVHGPARIHGRVRIRGWREGHPRRRQRHRRRRQLQRGDHSELRVELPRHRQQHQRAEDQRRYPRRDSRVRRRQRHNPERRRQQHGRSPQRDQRLRHSRLPKHRPRPTRLTLTGRSSPATTSSAPGKQTPSVSAPLSKTRRARRSTRRSIANNSVTNVDKAFGINGTTNTEIARNKVTNVNNTLYTAIRELEPPPA